MFIGIGIYTFPTKSSIHESKLLHRQSMCTTARSSRCDGYLPLLPCHHHAMISSISGHFFFSGAGLRAVVDRHSVTRLNPVFPHLQIVKHLPGSFGAGQVYLKIVNVFIHFAHFSPICMSFCRLHPFTFTKIKSV